MTCPACKGTGRLQRSDGPPLAVRPECRYCGTAARLGAIMEAAKKVPPMTPDERKSYLFKRWDGLLRRLVD